MREASGALQRNSKTLDVSQKVKALLEAPTNSGVVDSRPYRGGNRFGLFVV